MTEFLRSIKSDLLSRQMMPFVALLGVALLAAAGYAFTGGSSSSTPVAPAGGSGAAVAGQASALPVVVAPANPNEAVSETPGGTRYQSHGSTRDPFTPLPSPPAANSTSASGSASPTSKTPSSSSGSSGASSGGTSTGGEKSPAPAPVKPSKPAKPQFPYNVSVLFGLTPATPDQPLILTPYENLLPAQPLPSKKSVRISFARVTASGNGAVFKLVVPPILHGPGICLPSASECQTIDLSEGQAEELEYVEADGQLVVYELKVVSIVKKKAGASAAQAKRKASAARAVGKANAAIVSTKRASQKQN